MFVDFFNFFLNCMKQIFGVLKTFVLFYDFTFYDFLIVLLVIPIFIKIFHFIMDIEDNEQDLSDMRFNYRMERYDQYRTVHPFPRFKPVKSRPRFHVTYINPNYRFVSKDSNKRR